MTAAQAIALLLAGTLYCLAMWYAGHRESQRRARIERLIEAGILTTEVPDDNEERFARWAAKLEGRMRKVLDHVLDLPPARR